MTFIDWFAGIGGFRRGMELAGHKCVGFCEKDKYAVASYTSMHLITEEQRAYLETLSKRERQKEILKDEYKNGEWYADDVRLVEPRDIPIADCWCFGAPCQNFSIAGNLDGLRGSESVLVGEIFRLLKGIENRPEWLLYENVKGMLSSNKGWDYFAIISAMDELGFDVEWQIINSKDYVPQNRERVYTVGHFRGRGRREIFPLPRTDGENHVLQIGQRDSDRYHPQNLRTYDPEGIAPTLDSMSGGGRHPHIPVGGGARCIGGFGSKLSSTGQFYQQERIYSSDTVATSLTGQLPKGSNAYAIGGAMLLDKNRSGKERLIANTLTAREHMGVAETNQTGTAVAYPLNSSTTK